MMHAEERGRTVLRMVENAASSRFCELDKRVIASPATERRDSERWQGASYQFASLEPSEHPSTF
jgi:hypothetical protein